MAHRSQGFGVRTLAVLALCAALPAPAEDLPRHALETRALVAPDAVLAALPAELAHAEANGQQREMALLYLARANACRVIADWPCQRKAARDARVAAERAGDGITGVRALIIESRAAIALQDYTPGERLLGEAELELARTPSAELSADIYLAYSSLSSNLDKHALASEYADRGLAALGKDQGNPLRARLLRNRARAQAQLGDLDGARQSLLAALEVAKHVVDPKLAAELHLESARIARRAGEIDMQRAHARNVLDLARNLRNSQLDGMGHEALGLAALDAADVAEAGKELRAALDSFRSLELQRDELRVARVLLRLELEQRERVADVAPLAARVLELDDLVLRSDRAQAADDFDSRLKYARQELDVVRLESEAKLQRERVRLLTDRERLVGVATVAGVALLLVLAVSFLLQRRATRRIRSALAELGAAEARASELLRHSKGYVLLHDALGELTMVNPAVSEALGDTSENLVGRPLALYVAESDRAAFAEYLQRVDENGVDEGTVAMRHADGTAHYWRYSSRKSHGGRARSYVIATAVDVTEQVHQADDLREQNVRDVLTGTYNRRYIGVFERMQRDRGRWGCLAIDLDHFKSINDTYGHQQGDAVLVAFARFLSGELREGDAIVRLGGDEFVVLLPDCDAAKLDGLVERLRRSAGSAPCPFSIGPALRENAESLADTLGRADAAMYGGRRMRRGADLGKAH